MNNGNRAASLAAKFKEKAKAARKEIELPVPLPNDPDFVFPCVVRRIDIVTMVTAPSAGLPEQFVNDILGTVSPERLAELKSAGDQIKEGMKQRGMTVPELQSIQKFIRRVAQETCLEPRIVFADDDTPDAGDDCIYLDCPEFAHCSAEIIQALYDYGVNLSPAVPIRMKDDSEASLESIGNFPEKPTLPNAVHDGGEIRAASV